MTKAQAKNSPIKEIKEKKAKIKDRKNEDENALVGRVKKVIKKSRRKLSEEKFEKQLQRTIAFLEELQTKLNESNNFANKAVKQKKTKSIKKTKPANSTGKDKTSAVSVKPSVRVTAKSSQ